MIHPSVARRDILSVSNAAVAIAAATSCTARVASLKCFEDERLQIVLGVDDVAEWRVVDGDRNRRRLSHRLAGDRASVLERDRVALLRHDAAALHEAVGQAQIADLRGAPQQQVLQNAAEPGQEH